MLTVGYQRSSGVGFLVRRFDGTKIRWCFPLTLNFVIRFSQYHLQYKFENVKNEKRMRDFKQDSVFVEPY